MWNVDRLGFRFSAFRSTAGPEADAEEDLFGEDRSGRFAVDLDRATPPTVCTPVTVDRDPTTDDGLCELAFLAGAPEPAGICAEQWLPMARYPEGSTAPLDGL